jgi:protein-tyrosine-phosphatase
MRAAAFALSRANILAIQMTERIKLLVLCSDNLFRSQLAYGVLRQYHKLEVVAAGLECEHFAGRKLPRSLLRISGELGIDLSASRITMIEPCLIEWADRFVLLDVWTRALLRVYITNNNLPMIPLLLRAHLLGTYATPPVVSILSALEYDLTEDEIADSVDQIVMGSHKLARSLLNIKR